MTAHSILLRMPPLVTHVYCQSDQHNDVCCLLLPSNGKGNITHTELDSLGIIPNKLKYMHLLQSLKLKRGNNSCIVHLHAFVSLQSYLVMSDIFFIMKFVNWLYWETGVPGENHQPFTSH